MTRKVRWSFVLGAAAVLALLPSCKDDPKEPLANSTVHEEAKEPLVYSTIHEAAKKGDLADVKRHLARGVDVNARDLDAVTPLNWAACVGHKAVVEYLIGKGADVDAKDVSGHTPLHHVAGLKDYAIVEYLLGKGADVNAKDNLDRTPLFYATHAVSLHERRSDIVGGTPLHYAPRRGDKDVVELLKRHGARE